MKAETFLNSLEELAERLGIKLSYEDLRKGEVSTTGAMFVLRGARRIIIHRGLNTHERADLLAEILAAEDLDSVHLAPEVRSRLEAAGAGRKRGGTGENAAPETAYPPESHRRSTHPS
ncbi:MAG: hypothetical protein HY894_01040 [Deltaproteobacteria bacterium]|nr:hypothetical protein [Deltaproteobacteria bacterium]